MIGALLATLLVIGAFVAFRAVNRSDLQVRPTAVDYRASVRYLQQSGARVVYPRTLPAGWVVTRVDDSQGTRPGLGLSMLTADGAYVGFQQSATPLPELITTYVDPHPTAGSTVEVPSAVERHWATWTDSGGDTALAGHWHHESLLVFGSAPRSDLELVAQVLTTRTLGSGRTTGQSPPPTASSSRLRAPSSHSWQMVASFSPRSHRSRLSSSVVPPVSRARTTSISSARASS